MDTLTIFERATLANQFRILSFLDTANSESHIIDAEIFEDGYTGLYSEVLQHISQEKSKEICTETHDILIMFRYISNAIAKLTPDQRAGLDLQRIIFDGFDANNDDHYYFATFMIEKQGKYSEYAGQVINSHTKASLMRYRHMLPVYNEILTNNISDFGINELRQLINAV